MAIDARDGTSPFLSGYYAPVDDELTTGPLRMTGNIPAGLDGMYLRNGPNPAFPPIGRYHPFDGDGMVHAVTFTDGVARYRNRWVESKGLLAERRAGHALFGGLSEFQLPPQEVIDEVGMMKNTANTHVVRHAGRILAVMEAAKPTELSAELATLGEWDFDGVLTGPMTAHPKVDPATGEMIFFGYQPFPPYVRVHIADRDGRLIRSVDVDLPKPVMMHDFAVSARHVVLFDLPAVFDLDAMLAGGAGITWQPANGARIGVLDRNDPDGGVRWFDVEPFWVFHFLNAFDDGDTVVIDGCRAPRLNVAFGDDELGSVAPPTLHRWRLDLAAGAVTDEPLDDRAGDFPRINDRRAGSVARYGYVASSRSWEGDEVVFDGVVKHDLESGSSETFRYGAGTMAGEAAFAPDPSREVEDAGWLLNFVHDGGDDESSLVIVDAQALEEVARLYLPRRVPFGFHGSWLPAGQ